MWGLQGLSTCTIKNDIQAHLSHKKPEMFIPAFVYTEL